MSSKENIRIVLYCYWNDDEDAMLEDHELGTVEEALEWHCEENVSGHFVVERAVRIVDGIESDITNQYI